MSETDDRVRVWLELRAAEILMQRATDEALYGFTAIKLYPDGKWVRVDPKDITTKETE